MSRTMSEKAYATYVRRNVSRALDRDSWRLHAGYFYQMSDIAAHGLYIRVEWRWKFKGLEAVIDPYAVYGQEQRKEFTGDEALNDCVEWVTEQLIALAKAVRERTEPFKRGMVLYERALRGDVTE